MNGNAKKKAPPGSGAGVDTLLTTQGKHLQTGQEVRFVLVKGPTLTLQPDPVNPKAPKESFPLIAKFSESVVKPDFTSLPWKTARLYQQDIPKAVDDSDEEDGGPNQQPKKRWRARNPKEVGRQWVLQEQVEFLETMMAKRQKNATSEADANGNNGNPATSTRYEGLPEHNPSQYVLLETATDTSNNNIQVTMLPTPHATIAFSQPKATNALSMSEAEQAIQDQRGKITRFMMHDQQRIFQGQAPIHRSRTRLLGKLLPEEEIDEKTGKKKAGANKRKRFLAGDEEDDDDVMGDLAFRNRKGSAKARKELLSSFGDDGMKVDADGVLGGANDSMFGQRGQKFGRFQADHKAAAEGTSGGDDGGDAGAAAAAESTKGNDGLAMADDFYQRDVQAEYEELDYDANEQFDDDDVDVGETEVVIDDSHFNDDDDDDDVDDEVDGDRPSGAEGLASLAGFKLMLAKARGEITPEQAADLAARKKLQAEEADNAQSQKDKDDGDSSNDFLSKIVQSAEAARIEAESKTAANADNADADGKAKKPAFTGVEVDENGQRMITLEAVRREIWLNDGRIPMKRLTRIFDVSKRSSQDRQSKFKEAVRELCTMETDPVGGRVLVLKQHYRRANM
jgi:hypothetical protein